MAPGGESSEAAAASLLPREDRNDSMEIVSSAAPGPGPQSPAADALPQSVASNGGTPGGRNPLTPQNLGIASDVVSFGQSGASFGFGVAKAATNFGFGIATTCIGGSAAAVERAAAASSGGRRQGPNPLASALHAVHGAVSLAHRATLAGQDVAHGITQGSLKTAGAILGVAGARQGELVRRALGEETGEAVLALNTLMARFAQPVAGNATPRELLTAAAAWGAAQQAAARAREAEETATALPENSERWLRFTASTFGAAWFAGLVDGFSLDAVQRVREAKERGGCPGQAALACAGVGGSVDVIAFQESSRELFAPGYLVAADHSTGAVVIALRGTSSVSDALSDLTCEAAPLQLGGHDGFAHDGMLRAARRLEGKLADYADQGLASLGGASTGKRLRVVVAGHSLGAGVAALVAALWRDAGRFRGGGIDVECVAFACPQVLDAELAMAQSGHTTSIVVGDDMVPRFSLATAQDLRNAVLLIHNPEAAGLPPTMGARSLSEAQANGDEQPLLEAYAAVHAKACTSEGRLFPPGRLIYLLPGRGALLAEQAEFDELHISRDMVAAHMPRRYLLAVQEAERAAAPAGARAASRSRSPPHGTASNL